MVADLVDAVGGENWGAVDGVVRATVTARARVRALLPVGPRAESPYQVVVPTVVGGKGKAPLSMDTSVVQAPVRISCTFRVGADQIDDTTLVSQLARTAAQRVAAAEDLVLAFGNDAAAALNSAGIVQVSASATKMRCIAPPKAKPIKGSDAVAAVQKGMADLQSRGYFDPYGALMLGEMWASACVSSGNSDNKKKLDNLLGADNLVPLAAYASLPAKEGLLFSRNENAYDFIEVDAPSVAMIGYATGDNAGDLLLRVEERFVLRVSDIEAAVRLTIT